MRAERGSLSLQKLLRICHFYHQWWFGTLCSVSVLGLILSAAQWMEWYILISLIGYLFSMRAWFDFYMEGKCICKNCGTRLFSKIGEVHFRGVEGGLCRCIREKESQCFRLGLDSSRANRQRFTKASLLHSPQP